jgi:hypothetical protein
MSDIVALASQLGTQTARASGIIDAVLGTIPDGAAAGAGGDEGA